MESSNIKAEHNKTEKLGLKKIFSNVTTAIAGLIIGYLLLSVITAMGDIILEFTLPLILVVFKNYMLGKYILVPLLITFISVLTFLTWRNHLKEMSRTEEYIYLLKGFKYAILVLSILILVYASLEISKGQVVGVHIKAINPIAYKTYHEYTRFTSDYRALHSIKIPNTNETLVYDRSSKIMYVTKQTTDNLPTIEQINTAITDTYKEFSIKENSLFY